MSAAEGYIKFIAHHEGAEAPEHPLLEALDMARTRLHDLNLIGMREDGVGFGNLSIRDGEGFIISGSGTGGVRELGPDGYCRVLAFDIDANSVSSRGPIPASSESMSHGAVYAARPTAACVIHVHSHGLWLRLLGEGRPATDASATYGTPAMARAVAKLVKNLDGDSSVFAMTGHEDGIVAYGADIESASGEIIKLVRGSGKEGESA